ncbi:MAG TPA: hypothetical protein PKD53_14200 [Chloroflexaceae bacterium]|nr:hypothetical protein [Chloroflexaceae bacterium]
MPRGRRQPVVVDGVPYPSLSAAARALGVTPEAIRQRLLSPEERRRARGSEAYKAAARARFHARGYGARRRTTHSAEELRTALRAASARALQPRRAALAKLTPADVREIRRRHEDGETPTALAQAFGVTAANIALIIKRKIWEDV